MCVTLYLYCVCEYQVYLPGDEENASGSDHSSSELELLTVVSKHNIHKKDRSLLNAFHLHVKFPK